MSEESLIPTKANWKFIGLVLIVTICYVGVWTKILDSEPQNQEINYPSVVSTDTAQVVTKGIFTYLMFLNQDSVLVQEIVEALVLEGEKRGFPPQWLAAIMTHENWTLNVRARSSAGALGLMQIMPMHIPMPECEVYVDEDLFKVGPNICAGGIIFEKHLEECNGKLRCGLLAYNGCVGKEDTFKSCFGYPRKVQNRLLAIESESDL